MGTDWFRKEDLSVYLLDRKEDLSVYLLDVPRAR